MLVKTKHFGEIELEGDKLIYFDNGILGFENYKDYTILYDNEVGERPIISWLQNTEEPSLSLPVINPFLILENYNPEVEDELLESLGELKEENLIVLVIITVPSNVQNMTANLKAPIIINSETKKGCQLVAQNIDYEIKHNFYDKLKALKDAKGVEEC